MKRFLILLLTLCLLPIAAAAEEPYALTAAVSAESSALLALPLHLARGFIS